MKTIGILGGLGPQATMDFEARLHRVAQSMIPPQANSGYPPLIIYYHRRPPILIDDQQQPVQPLQPDPGLLAAAKHIGVLADFLVITANGPHALQAEFEAAAGRPILSMVDITLAEVKRRGWARVGVLGLGEPRVYLGPLSEMNLASEILPKGLQTELDTAIFAMMAGQNDGRSAAAAEAAIQYLRSRSVDGIVLGCTEIPLLLPDMDDQPDLLNPAQLLAETAVRRAIT